jgi:hypothetical protein
MSTTLAVRSVPVNTDSRPRHHLGRHTKTRPGRVDDSPGGQYDPPRVDAVREESVPPDARRFSLRGRRCRRGENRIPRTRVA